MKLYHGTQQHFNPGDMLTPYNDEKRAMPHVYATTSLGTAVRYTIHPPQRDWSEHGVLYFRLVANKSGRDNRMVLVKNFYTDNYVYEVESREFDLLLKYHDGSGDEWINPSSVEIVKSIEITPDILLDCGYDVRIIRGNSLIKNMIFCLAKTKLMREIAFLNEKLFYRFIGVMASEYKGRKE